MNRRRYLALSGTGLALLAGCTSSDTEPTSEETSTEDPEETTEPTDEPSPDESTDAGRSPNKYGS
jgi:PBP1b-binding outer membrane lipoprotein LpoB